MLEQAMDDYTQYLLRIGYYYTKDINRSRDLVQEVFIQLYYSNYHEQGQLKAYLGRLMRNRCIDYLRSWSHRMLVLQHSFTFEPPLKHTDPLVEYEERTLLEEAVLSLKIKLREVIVYYYLENMTTKEIATLLHTPESTIKTRLQKARTLLKKKLQHIEWEVLLDEII